MKPAFDNYERQLRKAQKHFLSYDQQELISRCALRCDEDYLYTALLSQPYRICRRSGRMERFCHGRWVDGNSFGEVMTVLDWLCDSRADRYITGRWVNLVTQGYAFHRELQEGGDANAVLFDEDPEGFCRACRALGGQPEDSGDVAYSIELLDGLRILVQLWRSDEEFPPRLRFLWDENTTRYIRYETTWYALGLLLKRLREQMEK